MERTGHLNPTAWRDGDARVAMACLPSSGIGAALRASFRPVDLPSDLIKLLARLH